MSDPTTAAGWGIQLSKLWTGAGQPFPIDARAIALEITPRRFKTEPIALVRPHGIPGIDGMLSKRKTKGDWCISYDENVTVPGRINFTIAHELGHYLLHRSQQTEFHCSQSDVLGIEKRRESEADRFASYLLMPADDFRAQCAAMPVSLDAMGECARRYGTSLTAAAIKFVEITEKAAMVVVARDGFVLWSFPSTAARKLSAYLPPATELHPDVDFESRDVVTVRPGVWHPMMEAKQSCIVSDQFDLAIFLIAFSGAGAVGHEEEAETDTLDFMQRNS